MAVEMMEWCWTLKFPKKTVYDERQLVNHMIGSIQGEDTANLTMEDQLMKEIENLKEQLENEKKKNSALELELKFLKLMLSNE